MARYKRLIQLFSIFLMVFLHSCGSVKPAESGKENMEKQAINALKSIVMEQASWAMKQMPVTVTADSSSRTAGNKHDFFSEGDYWWPDPSNANGPYIQKDGMTNPDNFVAHRLAMIRFSKIIGALASAYKITGDQKYAKQAMLHLNAWFINPTTLMNPNLQYAQAIKGRFTGRGIGIIDTIQLMEVAQGILVMQDVLGTATLNGSKAWFTEYLGWLMTHPYGKAEMTALNNHGTCFVMQVAAFARLTGDEKLLEFCSERYKTVLLPDQMAEDGSFPREMSRTKPYGYAIFNLDAMAALCQILSTKEDNLWNYTTANGRSIKKGIAYLHPFIADKSKWPLKPDVMYWDEWPVAQPFLLFGANAYKNNEWLSTWTKLNHDPKVEEVIRNLPIRNPLIWL
ncbi:alginate lyase family protein [Pedobacter psychroterrae]|uniref:Alginate lyase n=1 Tax=Pedobacter psychroterrae TaxID=2530453 RepID=A0A4R0NLB4_9SPHI|nr:alginate lyase family protein [Pedobacter psychroterrae]TCD01590.1 alginate lyase [Pedobacter psychroterrae]